MKFSITPTAKICVLFYCYLLLLFNCCDYFEPSDEALENRHYLVFTINDSLCLAHEDSSWIRLLYQFEGNGQREVMISPNERRVFTSEYFHEAPCKMISINARTLTSEILFTDSIFARFDVSQDGSQILYSQNDSVKLYDINLQSNQTVSQGTHCFFTSIPDLIVYCKNVNGTFNTVLRNIKTGEDSILFKYERLNLPIFRAENYTDLIILSLPFYPNNDLRVYNYGDIYGNEYGSYIISNNRWGDPTLSCDGYKLLYCNYVDNYREVRVGQYNFLTCEDTILCDNWGQKSDVYLSFDNLRLFYSSTGGKMQICKYNINNKIEMKLFIGGHPLKVCPNNW